MRRRSGRAVSAFPSFIRSSHCRSRAEMHGKNLFGRFLDRDALGLAADKGEDGALALAPHPADQRDVDVIALPRLKPRAFDPDAHKNLLLRCCRDDESGQAVASRCARNGRTVATLSTSWGRTYSPAGDCRTPAAW